MFISRYHSVRLDPVHYCEREIYLAAKRKRRSRFDRNSEPEDATQQRLQLFARTVRETQYLAVLVKILKMPYMIRETCKADLARTVSFLPHLQYVDLPEGVFSDDPASSLLKNELLRKCPDLRKMKYHSGSEESFKMLAHMRQWQDLEILEVKGLRIEPDTLLYVLASLPALRELKLGGISSLEDTIFAPNSQLPPFPPLTTLCLERCPSITTTGLVAYLSRRDTRESLERLSLNQTSVLAQNLHEVLANAPRLTSLTINDTVSRSLPLAPIPPLASRSLRTLHYEILPLSNIPNPPSETYHHYLASSLLSGSLPSLKELYAFCPSLPDLLLFTPNAPFAGGNRGNRFSVASSVYSSADPLGSTRSASMSGLISQLSLYTKPPEAPELEWSLTIIDPPSERNGRRGSATATRPLSLVIHESSPNSHSPGGRGHDSMLVGNGFGGYLSVPNLDGGGGSPRFSHRRTGSNAKGTEWMG